MTKFSENLPLSREIVDNTSAIVSIKPYTERPFDWEIDSPELSKEHNVEDTMAELGNTALTAVERFDAKINELDQARGQSMARFAVNVLGGELPAEYFMSRN